MFTFSRRSLDRLRDDLTRLRGDPLHPPDASVIIPVNASRDIQTVLTLLNDIISRSRKGLGMANLVRTKETSRHAQDHVQA
jgi:hypothetical protein